jgi:hypothetical protein
MKRAVWYLLPLTSMLLLLDALPAFALPAFARREGVKCQMCHYRAPELNADGHAYLRRGLREEPKGSMKGMDMGGETAKRTAAAVPRPLGEPLPFVWGDYLTIMGHHGLNAQRGAATNIDAGMIDMWFGGPVDQHWSGLANPVLGIEESGAEVEQAYGQYITSWGDRFGSVRFGQLLPMAILFRQGGPGMPLSAPVALSTSSGNLNPWSPSTPIRALEVGWIDLPRWDLYVGAGQPHFGDGDSSKKHVDLYSSAEVLLGKSGSSLSAFGYLGKTARLGEPARSFQRLGLLTDVYVRMTKLDLGFVWGEDDQASGPSLRSTGGFVLAEELLAEQWAVYGRYDYLKQDVADDAAKTTDGLAIGLSFWAQTQVRITLEGQFLKATGSPRDRTAAAELLWVF